MQGFLDRRIGFLDIARVVEQTLEKTPNGQMETLGDVSEIDAAARASAEALVAA